MNVLHHIKNLEITAMQRVQQFGEGKGTFYDYANIEELLFGMLNSIDNWEAVHLLSEISEADEDIFDLEVSEGDIGTSIRYVVKMHLVKTVANILLQNQEFCQLLTNEHKRVFDSINLDKMHKRVLQFKDENRGLYQKISSQISYYGNFREIFQHFENGTYTYATLVLVSGIMVQARIPAEEFGIPNDAYIGYMQKELNQRQAGEFYWKRFVENANHNTPTP